VEQGVKAGFCGQVQEWSFVQSTKYDDAISSFDET